jgi:hypothetical protein
MQAPGLRTTGRRVAGLSSRDAGSQRRSAASLTAPILSRLSTAASTTAGRRSAVSARMACRAPAAHNTEIITSAPALRELICVRETTPAGSPPTWGNVAQGSQDHSSSYKRQNPEPDIMSDGATFSCHASNEEHGKLICSVRSSDLLSYYLYLSIGNSALPPGSEIVQLGVRPPRTPWAKALT